MGKAKIRPQLQLPKVEVSGFTFTSQTGAGQFENRVGNVDVPLQTLDTYQQHLYLRSIKEVQRQIDEATKASKKSK